MKRLILILAVMMFTGMSANAYYVSMAGHPTYTVSHSGHMRPINNYGSNAPFIRPSSGSIGYYGHNRGPGRYSRPAGYSRLRGHDRFARPYGYYVNNGYYDYNLNYNNGFKGGYNGGYNPSVGPSQVSRLDKNYKITSHQKSYTRNGITYFD